MIDGPCWSEVGKSGLVDGTSVLINTVKKAATAVTELLIKKEGEKNLSLSKEHERGENRFGSALSRLWRKDSRIEGALPI